MKNTNNNVFFKILTFLLMNFTVFLQSTKLSCAHEIPLSEKDYEIQSYLAGRKLIIENKFGILQMKMLEDGFFETSPMQISPPHQHFQSKPPKVMVGQWRVHEGQLCTRYHQPNAPAKENCEPIEGRKLGDSWEKTDPRNGKVIITLSE